MRPTGAGKGELQRRKSAFPDGSVGQDVTLRGNPISENNQGGVAANARSLSLMTSGVDSGSVMGRG